jgi:putative addiction module component (TIGR02574 family)
MDPKQLLSAALRLPPETRAALAGELIQSLETEVDEDAESAWADEIGRRTAELEAGTVKTIPWEEVRKKLFARLDER